MNTSDKPIDIVGPNYYNIAIPVANYGAFQELIQRGANLWPDAPPAIKEFADLVTSGRVMQDYRKQDTSKKILPSIKNSYRHNLATNVCADCGYPSGAHYLPGLLCPPSPV
jgi:hypothetical protein